MSARFKCSLCANTYKYKSCVHAHERVTHGMASNGGGLMNQCSRCSFRAYSAPKLAEHELNIHTGDAPEFPCDMCDRAYRLRGSIDRHKAAVHRKRVDKVVAKVVAKVPPLTESTLNTTTTNTAVKVVNDTTKPAAFKCPQCARAYRHAIDLHLHKSQGKCVPPGEASSPKLDNMQTSDVYKCDICYKSFISHCRLTRHVNTVHLKIARYKCPACPHYSSFERCNVLRHCKSRHPSIDLAYLNKHLDELPRETS